MKILLVHNYYKNRGGEDSVVENERRMLEENGQIVEIYSEHNDRITTTLDRIETFVSTSYSNKSKIKIIKVIEAFRPDIIHVHNLFPLITPAVYDAAIESKIPVIQTLHNYRIACSSALLFKDEKPCEICITKSPFNAVKYRCYRQSLIGSIAVAKMIQTHKRKNTWNDKVDQFIALTEFAKSKFIDYKIDSNKITIKPNFIPDATFAKNSGHGDIVLFVGRLSPEKGIETLLEAWEISANPKLTLRIIGEGPLLEYTKNRSRLLKNVEVLGQKSTETVRHEMGNAKCLIFPSQWYEGFPMVLVEALASGLPTICSNLGSMPSIIKHGETGLLFQPNNPIDLKNKLEEITSDIINIEAMRENCIEEYQNNYTSKKNYAQLMSIYKDAISSRKGTDTSSHNTFS